jgi:hypothetical protein
MLGATGANLVIDLVCLYQRQEWINGCLTHTNRKWLLARFDPEEFLQLVPGEWAFTLGLAQRYPRNYYAWAQMQWLLEHVVTHVPHAQRTNTLKTAHKLVSEWRLTFPEDQGAVVFLCELETALSRLADV